MSCSYLHVGELWKTKLFLRQVGALDDLKWGFQTKLWPGVCLKPLLCLQRWPGDKLDLEHLGFSGKILGVYSNLYHFHFSISCHGNVHVLSQHQSLTVARKRPYFLAYLWYDGRFSESLSDIFFSLAKTAQEMIYCTQFTFSDNWEEN